MLRLTVAFLFLCGALSAPVQVPLRKAKLTPTSVSGRAGRPYLTGLVNGDVPLNNFLDAQVRGSRISMLSANCQRSKIGNPGPSPFAVLRRDCARNTPSEVPGRCPSCSLVVLLEPVLTNSPLLLRLSSTLVSDLVFMLLSSFLPCSHAFMHLFLIAIVMQALATYGCPPASALCSTLPAACIASTTPLNPRLIRWAIDRMNGMGLQVRR